MLRFCTVVVLLLAMAQLSRGIISHSMKHRITDLHNQLRRQVKPGASNMRLMSWTDELGVVAQEHAENCQWEPNDMRHSAGNLGNLFPGGVGESMSLSYGGSAVTNQNPEEFIREWYNEKYFYNLTYNTCEQDRMCEHYTQMVNYRTAYVGCGFAICHEMEFYGAHIPIAAFFVCNYGHLTEGNRPYTVGPPCQSCQPGFQRCIDGLCAYGAAQPITPPTTVAPTTAEPTTAEPTTEATTTVAPTDGQNGTTDPSAFQGPVDCEYPKNTYQRELCWLRSWTDWRNKFDEWANNNCPGPV